MAEELLTVRLYYDYKSPFTYLAMHPAYALMESHRVRLHYIPHEFNVRGIFGGELDQRPERDWRKVRYLYLDARRYANARGMIIRGPQKDLRLETLADVRSVCGQARTLPALFRSRLRALLQARARHRKPRGTRRCDEGNRPRPRGLPIATSRTMARANCQRHSRPAIATGSSACRLSSSMESRFGVTIESNGSSRSSTQWA